MEGTVRALLCLILISTLWRRPLALSGENTVESLRRSQARAAGGSFALVRVQRSASKFLQARARLDTDHGGSEVDPSDEDQYVQGAYSPGAGRIGMAGGGDGPPDDGSEYDEDSGEPPEPADATRTPSAPLGWRPNSRQTFDEQDDEAAARRLRDEVALDRRQPEMILQDLHADLKLVEDGDSALKKTGELAATSIAGLQRNAKEASGKFKEIMQQRKATIEETKAKELEAWRNVHKQVKETVDDFQKVFQDDISEKLDKPLTPEERKPAENPRLQQLLANADLGRIKGAEFD